MCFVTVLLTWAWIVPLCHRSRRIFFRYDWPKNGVKPYLQVGPLSKILTFGNLRHAASRIWICTETWLRLFWIEFSGNENHFTTAPLLWSTKSWSTKLWLLVWINKIFKIVLEKELPSKAQTNFLHGVLFIFCLFSYRTKNGFQNEEILNAVLVFLCLFIKNWWKVLRQQSYVSCKQHDALHRYLWQL